MCCCSIRIYSYFTFIWSQDSYCLYMPALILNHVSPVVINLYYYSGESVSHTFSPGTGRPAKTVDCRGGMS